MGKSRYSDPEGIIKDVGGSSGGGSRGFNRLVPSPPNKLTAPKGTTHVVPNSDLSTWAGSGWQLIEQYDTGHVLIRRK